MDKLTDTPSNPPAQATHCSFVLRCWIGEQGQVHSRLISVSSGTYYNSVIELSDLPDLLHRLVADSIAPDAPTASPCPNK